MFPGVSSFTSADSLTVRGKASDQTGIKSITVNDIPVATSNQWGDWQLKLTGLQDGENQLIVKAEDTLGQTTEQVLKVSKQLPMFAPELSALDASGNVLYIYDSYLNAIFSVDLATGARSVLKPKEGETNLFSNPTAMVYDPVKKRLLMTDLNVISVTGFSDYYVGRIISINPQSGERSLFAVGDSLPDITKPSLSLRAPVSLTIDPTSRSLYVLDPKSGFISNDRGVLKFDYAILKYPLDVDAPSFTLVSENQNNKVDPLIGSRRIRFDRDNNRLITDFQFGEQENSSGATEALYGLMAVDTASGVRSIISGKNVHTDENYLFKIIENADFFVDAGFAYYIDRAPDTDANSQRILKINLTSGERSEWFANKAADNKSNLRNLIALDYDSSTKQLYAIDFSLDTVYKIDTLNKFQRTPVAGNGTTRKDTSINYLSSNALLLDQRHQRLLMNDRRDGTVQAYSLSTGTASILCSFGALEETPILYQPIDSALDETNQRVISVVNAQFISANQVYNSSRIDSCDLETGTTSVLAKESTVAASSLTVPISALALDASNKAYLFDTTFREVSGSYYEENIITQVDLATGTRSEYAALQSKESPKGALALNKTSGQIAYSHLSSASINSIDPSTKAILPITNNLKDNSTPLLIPKKLFWLDNTLVALDSARKTLLSIQPDGKRNLLYSINPTGPNPINQISSLAIDAANQRLFATDQATGVLALQDMTTGESIYLDK